MGDNEPGSVPAALEKFMDLARRYVADENVWTDDHFIPLGASKDHRDAFRQLYSKYFSQIIETNGFDVDFYPGNAEAALFEPYLEFEDERDMLMELANHAIDGNNKKKTSLYEYKVIDIEKVNFVRVEAQREFFMTVIVQNLTLRTHEATFLIRAHKGVGGQNVIVECSKKNMPV